MKFSEFDETVEAAKLFLPQAQQHLTFRITNRITRMMFRYDVDDLDGSKYDYTAHAFDKVDRSVAEHIEVW